MTMLPDITEDEYRRYQAEQFAQDSQRQIDTQLFEQATAQQLATLPSSDALTNPLGSGNAAVQMPQAPPEVVDAPIAPPLPPEPAPAPAPPPVAPPPGPQPAPTPAPAPSPTTSPSTSGAGDWFGSALSAVEKAGGDVQTFASNLHSGTADIMGSALGAAEKAGADVQTFASNFTPPAPAPVAAPSSSLPSSGAAAGRSAVSGVPDWLAQLIAANAPGDLAADPDFIRTVAAGAKAESGWDPNRVQNGFAMGSGKGARGLFQFDMGGMGAGIPEEQLLGERGAQLQASRIIPLYAKAYQSAPAGLSGAEKASWVAAQAERPFGYTDPSSAARRNYAGAYNEIGGGGGGDGGPLGAIQGLVSSARNAAGQVFPLAAAPTNKPNQTYHSEGGSDLMAPRGTPVLSMQDGVVTQVYTDKGDHQAGGNGVLVRGTDGLEYYYAHFDAPPGVQPGDKVSAGQQIGAVGNSGNAFKGGQGETHLHIGVGEGISNGVGAEGGLGRNYNAQAVLTQLMGTLQPGSRPLHAPITDAASAVGNAIGSAASSAVQGVTSAASAARQSIAEQLGLTQDALGNIVNQASSPATRPSSLGAEPLGIFADPTVAPVAEDIRAAGQARLQQLPAGIQSPSEDTYLGGKGVLGQAIGTAASALGSGTKLGFDVTNEIMPTTHLARLEEGSAGELRRDPAYAAALNRQFELHGAVAAGDPSAQAESRQLTDLMEQRRQEIMAGQDLGSVYRRGLASPDRETAEALAGIVAGVASAGAASTPGLRTGAERLALALDPSGAPFAAAGELLGPVARGLRGGQVAAEGLAMVDPRTLEGLSSTRITTPERTALRAGIEEGPRWPDNPELPRNMQGTVLDAVLNARRTPTPDELAAAQQAIDSTRGTSALNAFPEAQTAEGLAGVRQQLRALADKGADQRFWYDDSSKAIMEAVQGNKEDGEKIAQLVAIYSNNTPVDANMNNAMTAWNQFKAGRPIDAPTLSENNRRAHELLYQGKDWDGAKTNNFYRNLMKNIDNDRYVQMGKEDGQTGVTVDVWMMRALNSARKAPSPKTGQYEFAANEVAQIARERGWTPEQAQAAIWVATKAGSENTARKVPMDLSAEGTFHYGTALANRLGRTNVTDVLRDADGTDVVARDLGLLGADGKISLPQARQTREDRDVIGPLGEAQGAVDWAARKGMTAYVAAQAKLQQLPEAYWVRQFHPKTLDNANGMVVSAGRALADEELRALQANLDEIVGAGNARVVPHETGAWIVNRSDAPNKAFHKASDMAVKRLESVATARTTPSRFDGEFLSNDWSRQPDGEGYLGAIRLGRGEGDAWLRQIEDRVRGGAVDSPGAVGGQPGRGAGSYGDDYLPAPDLSGGGLSGSNVASFLSRGAAPLRSDLARGAVSGAIGGGYEAAQDEGATPESIAAGALGGSALGSLRGGLGGEAGRALGIRNVGRISNLFDDKGNLIGKPSDAEERLNSIWQPGQPEPANAISQLLSPAGNLLSTVAGRAAARETVPGRNLLDLSAISRTAAGAEPWTLNPPSSETLKAMPNLMHLAEGMPDVQATFQRIAEDSPDLITKYRQGTISHADLIADTAEKLGMTSDDFLKTKVGQAFNPQELLALRAAVTDKMNDVGELVGQINAKGGIDKLGADEKLAAVSTMMDAARLQAIARGGAATAGRTLNQQKITVDRHIASLITGGNEGVAAQRKAVRAQAKLDRTAKLLEEQGKLAAEREARRAEAQADRTAARSARSDVGPNAADAPVWDRIDQAYQELDAYKAMSLQEKEEEFGRRAAARAERAARRAELDDPQQLLKALQSELSAERNMFSGDRKAFDKLMDEQRLRELRGTELGDRGVAAGAGLRGNLKGDLIKLQEGAQDTASAAWLKAQAKVAQQEADEANALQARAWSRQSNDAESQRGIATQILGRLGGTEITDKMISQLVKTMDSNDPMASAKFLQGLQKTSWWDRLATLRYASMLSSTATHSAQLVSNTGQLGMALATHPLAVGVDALTSAVKGGERTRYLGELPEMLRGIIGQGADELEDLPLITRGAAGGLRQGALDAKEILASGLNPGEVSRNWEAVGRPGFGFGQTRAGQAVGPGASKAVDVIAEGPLRLLEAGDALIRGGARGAYAHGLAARQAIREGLSGEARRARVDDIIQNMHQYPELFGEADNAAKRVVLQEPRQIPFTNPKSGGAAFAQSLIMPFVRTPWNVAMQGAGLTPAGYLGALTAAGKGERGEAVDRAARATLGTGILAGAYAAADQGLLTGGMPTDAGERSALPDGWQPYSVRIPKADGTSTYVRYSNIGPVGVPLALAATAADAKRHGVPNEPAAVVGRFAGGFGRYMLDQSMLQGLNNFLDAVTDPEHKLENFAEGMATQFAPYGALGRQIDRALGTGPRDPHGLLDSLQSTYPGLSSRVQPRLNSLGEEVPETQTGLGQFASPLRYSQETENPTLQALRDVGDVGIGAPPTTARGVRLTPEERRAYQTQAGQYIDQIVSAITADPAYRQASSAEQQVILRRAIERARAVAQAELLGGLTEDDLLRRLAEEKTRQAAVPSPF